MAPAPAIQAPAAGAASLCYNGKTKEMSGYMAQTTNNRMEIFAVISGLGALKEPCIVEVYSDSAYTVNAFNEHWIDNWQKNGWMNSKKQSRGKQRSLEAAFADHSNQKTRD